MDLKMSLRPLDAAFLSHDDRLFTAVDQRVEQELRRVFFLKMTQLKTVAELTRSHKLLIVSFASAVDESAIFRTVNQIRDAIFHHLDPVIAQTPALFITRLPQENLRSWAEAQYVDNWYCDLISCDHLFELALRASNLLRICDHLREMQIYEQDIRELKAQVSEIEGKLEQYLDGKP